MKQLYPRLGKKRQCFGYVITAKEQAGNSYDGKSVWVVGASLRIIWHRCASETKEDIPLNYWNQEASKTLRDHHKLLTRYSHLMYFLSYLALWTKISGKKQKKKQGERNTHFVAELRELRMELQDITVLEVENLCIILCTLALKPRNKLPILWRTI